MTGRLSGLRRGAALPETSPNPIAPPPVPPERLRVILFIGHHKVGSTSLQDYLSRNAVALAQAGILYPYVDFEGMAHMAASASGRNGPDEALPINVREPHNALAFRMIADAKGGSVPAYHKRLPAIGQMLHAIRQQVRFQRPHTVILAAEVFANFPAIDSALAEQVKALFPDADFTLVATLRRIDTYLASWHGQRLKFGHQIAPLREGGIDEYLGGIHFNYRLMLEGWLKAFPDCEPVIRSYDEVRAGGGSVADFVARTALPVPDGLAPERRENDSLHRGIYEIVRHANHDLPRNKAATLRKDLRALCPDLGLPESASIELFGGDNRARILDRFRPIDTWLGDVVGRPAFFPDLDAVAATDPIPELDAMRDALPLIRDAADRSGDTASADFIATLDKKQAF